MSKLTLPATLQIEAQGHEDTLSRADAALARLADAERAQTSAAAAIGELVRKIETTAEGLGLL